MDILLTHGYFLYEDPKELQIMKPYPPLGILYIYAHLRSKGLNVEVFDSTFSSRQQLFELLRQGPPSVVGIYANLMTRAERYRDPAGRKRGWLAHGRRRAGARRICG